MRQYLRAKGLLLLFIYSKQCISDGPLLFQPEDLNSNSSFKTLHRVEKKAGSQGCTMGIR